MKNMDTEDRIEGEYAVMCEGNGKEEREREQGAGVIE